MSKTLANAFNITNSNLLKLNDYEIFQDKEALEKIKNDITFSLIDEVSLGLKETDIHSKVDEYTKSLNLSTLEKQYLYNLIENEIYGIGPLTEVMNDDSVKKIFVNSASSIYVLTNNGYHKDESISFINNEHIIKSICFCLNLCPVCFACFIPFKVNLLLFIPFMVSFLFCFVCPCLITYNFIFYSLF